MSPFELIWQNGGADTLQLSWSPAGAPCHCQRRHGASERELSSIPGPSTMEQSIDLPVYQGVTFSPLMHLSLVCLTKRLYQVYFPDFTLHAEQVAAF